MCNKIVLLVFVASCDSGWQPKVQNISQGLARISQLEL